MACVEDCDQILIASSIKDSQGWEENGNSSSQGELKEEETVSDTERLCLVSLIELCMLKA